MLLGTILLWVIALYFLCVFFLSRLFVPFMGFSRWKMPAEIPVEIKQEITELEKGASTKSEYLKAAFAVVTTRWHGDRMKTVRFLPKAFRSDLRQIWRETGYAHCTTQNYLLYVLLTGSKFFAPEDIEVKYVFLNCFIHQFLRIKVAGTTVDADPAGTTIAGIPLGAHLQWFG